jgi:uncharacterized protein YbjT (DUF2867 family)
MNVILFGATGMVGQAVLRECLIDPEITNVLVISRSPLATQDPKLRSIIHNDLANLAPIQDQLKNLDACFYCIGVTSAGLAEPEYRRVTYNFTIAAAQALLPQNPNLTFLFISGAGADSTEKGSTMWARVKGATENALLRMPFKAVYVIRPAYIQPLHGIKSRTRIYRVLYVFVAPIYPVLRAFFPKYVTTTEQLGRAMIYLARNGAPKHILESADINTLVH